MSESRTAAYWKKRFEALEDASNTYGQQTYRLIEPAFDKAQREIQSQIESWYVRFAKNNNITMQEAKKLLSTNELKEFRWDVKEYIKYGRENDLNQAWMKELENASARVHINRLEALKVRTQNALEVAFGNELDCIDDMARKIFTEDYYHTIYEVQKGFGIGWEIGQIDNRKLETLISKPWASDGKNFSQRIWQQRSQLVNELHTQLTRMCILGKAPNDAIDAISKKFNTTKSQAGRLVMTEQAYFHSVAQKDAFEDLDVEEFEIVATLDSHTSEICQDMDGKHFPMKDYQPGVTAPPFHVWCRSVTVPWFEDNYTGERAARDEDDNTYYVPDSMTYADWKKSMVDGDTDGLTSADEGVQRRTNAIEKMRESPIWSGLPEEKRDFILDSIKNGDVDIIENAERCMENCSVSWNGDSSYYMRGTGHITMRDYETNEELARTFWHEYGHFMDDASISKSGFGYTYRYRNGTSYFADGVSIIVEETGYKQSAYDDLKQMLDKLGLSDKYDVKLPTEYESQWIIKKSTGDMLDTLSDHEGMFELNHKLADYIDECCGLKKANNYLYDMGYPKSPNWNDYFETYTTPKRQTVKTRPKYKGAEDAWQKAQNDNWEARKLFESTHDMDALIEEQQRLKKLAESKHDLFGAVTDTFDGLAHGAFNTTFGIGGHTPTYYQTNYGNIHEGVANVHEQLMLNDPDLEELFNDVCPNTYELIKKGWKYHD